MTVGTNRGTSRGGWGAGWLVTVAVICLGVGFTAGLLLGPRFGPPTAAVPAVTATVAAERFADPAAATPDLAERDQHARLGAAAAALSRVPQLAAAQSPPPAQPVQDHRHLTMDELPKAVRDVLGQLSLGRKMHKLDLQTGIRRGVRLYRGEFELDGFEHEYRIDETGKIMESEIDVPVTDLPGPVTEGVQGLLPGATVTEVERKQEEDAPPFFEVEVQHQGQRHELHVTENGEVLRNQLR